MTAPRAGHDGGSAAYLQRPSAAGCSSIARSDSAATRARCSRPAPRASSASIAIRDALARGAHDARALGRSRRARPRRLPGDRRGARCARRRARRRRARRSRRLVDAVRRAGPRLQLSARRAARHAHGSQRRRDRRGTDRPRRRARARGRDLRVRRGTVLAADRARHRRRAPRRPIDTTGRAGGDRPPRVPERGYQRIDPATRTFQALRIWVNRELEGLDSFSRPRRGGCAPARGSSSSLSTRSRTASSSTRSRARAQRATRCVQGADKEADGAGREEIRRNPRARSAKLRAAETAGVTDGRIIRIRDPQGRPQQPDRPRSRRSPPARAVEVGRDRRRCSWSCCCSPRGQHFELIAATATASSSCRRQRSAEEEMTRQLRLEIETLRSPKRIEMLATSSCIWSRRSATSNRASNASCRPNRRRIRRRPAVTP